MVPEWGAQPSFFVVCPIALTVTIRIDLVDHVLQLCLCRVLPKRAHDSSQFLGGDGTIAVCERDGCEDGERICARAMDLGR